jgi:alkylhydroperoxidase family enzyme
MTDDQREIYDAFAGGRRAAPGVTFSLVAEDGSLLGPPKAWINSPVLGVILEKLGAAIRFDLSLTPRAREIAMLMCGHNRKCAYELTLHTLAGRNAGLSEADLAALAAERPPELVTDEERTVYAATKQLLETHALPDAAYAEAVSVLGVRTLVELVTLVGYFEMVATQLAAFDISADGA